MPKMKTSRTAAKRFKKTGTGQSASHEQADASSTCSRSKSSVARARRLDRATRDVHPDRREEDQAPPRRALRRPDSTPRERPRRHQTWHA
jgi:ribosomal protein L35